MNRHAGFVATLRDEQVAFFDTRGLGRLDQHPDGQDHCFDIVTQGGRFGPSNRQHDIVQMIELHVHGCEVNFRAGFAVQAWQLPIELREDFFETILGSRGQVRVALSDLQQVAEILIVQ